MNKKISRKDFLKNNALTWGGLSLGLGVPCNFHTKSILSRGKKDSTIGEFEILLAERAPFQNWYRQTWIRSSSSPLNVHRAYDQLRDFITSNKKVSPMKPEEKAVHQIEQAKVWSKFLDNMEKLNLK